MPRMGLKEPCSSTGSWILTWSQAGTTVCGGCRTFQGKSLVDRGTPPLGWALSTYSLTTVPACSLCLPHVGEDGASLSCHGRLYSSTSMSQINPFSSKLLLALVFYHRNREKTSTLQNQRGKQTNKLELETRHPLEQGSDPPLTETL